MSDFVEVPKNDWARIVTLYCLNTRRKHLYYHEPDFYDYRNGVYVPVSPTDISAELAHFYGTRCYVKVPPKKEGGTFSNEPCVSNTTSIREMLAAIKHNRNISQKEMAAPVWITAETKNGEDLPDEEPTDFINCRNGLYNLRTRQMRNHTPDLFAFNQTAYPCLTLADPPTRFLQMQDEIWPTPEEQDCKDLWQEWVGANLVAGNPWQKFLAMVGVAGGGKSALAQLLMDVVGASNCATTNIDALGSQFGMGSLRNKQSLVCFESIIGAKADKAAASRNIHLIAGGDPVMIDIKHGTPWEGTLPGKLTFVGNAVSKLPDEGGGLRRRTLLLPFNVSFTKKPDLTLREKLQPELPGIFNWALDGLRRLRERGHFVQPKSGEADLQTMSEHGAPVRGFVDEHCEIVESDKVMTSS